MGGLTLAIFVAPTTRSASRIYSGIRCKILIHLIGKNELLEILAQLLAALSEEFVIVVVPNAKLLRLTDQMRGERTFQMFVFLGELSNVRPRCLRHDHPLIQVIVHKRDVGNVIASPIINARFLEQ